MAKRTEVLCKIRITADSQDASDAARTFLEGCISTLKLQKGRVGRNPKYAADPKVLAYGEFTFLMVPK